MSTNLENAVAAVRNMPEKKWTPDHELWLIDLWAAGKTGYEISKIFKESGFNVSRNGVIAKATRLRKSGINIAVRGTPILRKENA